MFWVDGDGTLHLVSNASPSSTESLPVAAPNPPAAMFFVDGSGALHSVGAGPHDEAADVRDRAAEATPAGSDETPAQAELSASQGAAAASTESHRIQPCDASFVAAASRRSAIPTST